MYTSYIHNKTSYVVGIQRQLINNRVCALVARVVVCVCNSVLVLLEHKYIPFFMDTFFMIWIASAFTFVCENDNKSNTHSSSFSRKNDALSGSVCKRRLGRLPFLLMMMWHATTMLQISYLLCLPLLQVRRYWALVKSCAFVQCWWCVSVAGNQHSTYWLLWIPLSSSSSSSSGASFIVCLKSRLRWRDFQHLR